MTKAIRFDKAGGPEVMKWVDVEVGEPGKGEIRVKHHAVGLNFIDVYFRTGLYPMPLPGGLGMEAAGEVTAVGEGVTRLQGRRSRGVCVASAGRVCAGARDVGGIRRGVARCDRAMRMPPR